MVSLRAALCTTKSANTRKSKARLSLTRPKSTLNCRERAENSPSASIWNPTKRESTFSAVGLFEYSSLSTAKCGRWRRSLSPTKVCARRASKEWSAEAPTSKWSVSWSPSEGSCLRNPSSTRMGKASVCISLCSIFKMKSSKTSSKWPKC